MMYLVSVLIGAVLAVVVGLLILAIRNDVREMNRESAKSREHIRDIILQCSRPLMDDPGAKIREMSTLTSELKSARNHLERHG